MGVRLFHPYLLTCSSGDETFLLCDVFFSFSDSGAHHFHFVSSHFITFHHHSSHFISSHPITVSPPLYPSFAHLPLPSSPLRFQLVIPAHSVRPSPLLYTSHSHGSQRYLVSHSSSPDTLHPTSFIVGSPSLRVCFLISFRTLMAATCRPDILSNTQ